MPHQLRLLQFIGLISLLIIPSAKAEHRFFGQRGPKLKHPTAPSPTGQFQSKTQLSGMPRLSCQTTPEQMAQWRKQYARRFRQQWHQTIAQIVIPPNAIAIKPGESIQTIVDQSPSGTAFVLEAGIHRLQTIAPKSGMKFYGRQHQGKLQTIINGATQLKNFQREGKLYSVANQTQNGQVHGETRSGYRRAAHPEDLFINNQPLIHVDSKTKVAPGKWHFDYAANTVYFADDPTGKTVELSTNRVAFKPSAPGVTIAGLIVEKYANPAQLAAIGDQKAAADWTILANEVRLNHGVGIRAGDNSRARYNYIHHNGQLGIAANGKQILIEHNEIAANNFAQYDAGWEAGGSKFAFTTHLTVRHNLVYANDGPGLWTDIDNRHTRYAQNVVYHNADMGIFHEISYDAVIQGNYVAHNGRYHPWLYGSNIMISTSQNVAVTGNTVEVNPDYGNGIGIVWQRRGKDYRATGNRVHHNHIRYLGKTGRSGVATDIDIGQKQIFQTNRFNHNQYYVPKNARSARYEWQNQQTEFAPLQASGQEQNGQENLCP